MNRNLTFLLALILVMSLVAVSLLFVFGGTDEEAVVLPSYNPYDSGGEWYKGQLHCHSDRSDGAYPPAEVVTRYADLGFDFIALTDHNTVTVVRDTSILVIGQEYGKGSVESGSGVEMNGFNVSSSPNLISPLQDRIDDIVSQNGVVSLNHPTRPFASYSDDQLVGLANYSCLEILNARHSEYRSVDWDFVLSHGKMAWGVATDDEHQLEDFGKAWIEVRMTGNLSTANVTRAMAHGSFFSTQGPMFDNISFNDGDFEVSCPGADRIDIIGGNGSLLQTTSGEVASYHPSGDENYLRAEAVKGGLKAWTQPVFIGPKNPTPSSSGTQPSAGEIQALPRERLVLAKVPITLSTSPAMVL